MATLGGALILAISFGTIQNILIVAIGLGLVIFFHELGHFAVAKWCNVNVERFSIGFGPILLSWKWGETEYALSAIPFGGYVKMLGQDDADPSQMTSVEIEQDPRSYIAKNVPQRMAIISAGVIMNIITGIFFYAFAFNLGVDVPPAKIGLLAVGKPAWEAGIREGDTLTRMNGREILSFKDIVLQTALTSSEVLDVEGIRADGETFQTKIYPEMNKTRREIGVGPTSGLIVAYGPDLTAEQIVLKGSAAAKAEPPFMPGDKILAINGAEVKTYTDLVMKLAQFRSEEVIFQVQRSGESNQQTALKVPAQPFRTLGLWMDISNIESIQVDSPAEKAGLKTGDKIISVDDLDVGTDINPLMLPEYLADHHTGTVKLKVQRESPGTGGEELEFSLTPSNRPGWQEFPYSRNMPLSAPAIGIAFHIIPTVLKVEEGSPAAGKVAVGDIVSAMELILPEGVNEDRFSKLKVDLNIPLSETERNWAHAFGMLQQAHSRHARLTLKTENSEEKKVVIEPVASAAWFYPGRGVMLSNLLYEQKAETFGEAMSLGIANTRNSATDIYLTLKNLLTQNLSVKELHGPIGIAKVAYRVSEEGFADFLQFLGFLSINLAVLNFLPIPLLDGGHMVFLIWEGITRKKPNETVQIVATYVGMAFVLSLMVLVIFLDLFVHGFNS